jgi:crossover junction endodeoxyribonuclease RuvC
MYVAGIDVGLTKENPSGVAIVRPQDIKYTSVIMPDMKAEWPERVDGVIKGIEWFLQAYLDLGLIELIAYELPYVGKNSQTAIKLAHIGGAVRALAIRYEIPCIGVTPLKAKQVLTGNGRAEKEDMIRAVKLRYKKDVSKDEADAVGVALAGYNLWLESVK